MKDIVKIDDETISVESFMSTLKLSGRFDGLIEDMLRDKLIVHAAKKQGIEADIEAVQEKSEQYRRVMGLHRAKDTIEHFDRIGVSLDDFEAFLSDSICQEKMMAQVQSDAAVEEYFRLHSPRFDSVEVSHIVLDTEGKAREVISILEDDPDAFAEMVADYSEAETRENGGKIGKVLRGSLSGEVESKLFNANEGDILGPFSSGDGSRFEIFSVDVMTTAELNEETRAEIKRLLKDEWLAARAKEHHIEAL